MSPDELLDQVHDKDSFIRFARALAEERESAQEEEQQNQDRYFVDGARGWKNGDVSNFLYAALEYFQEGPHHNPEKEPSWKMLADFLYFGKIYE